jgi:hypothetical protein
MTLKNWKVPNWQTGGLCLQQNNELINCF